ncbi:MAG: low-specificity L-threonine aldolase [Armatimonadota bacterium]|nr:low-specificity L-threonine aldolase [Armatimonadota bacterium]MDR5703821.1 low-specificity L-threonine aldolase [Armatimonadota bacterium]
MPIIDLRSDTVTQPTEEMREAMARAEVGDDVYGEDPTVNALEELAAQKVGKERALFVPSGTMGNLIAVLTHTQRGDEVLLEAESHIYYYEVGGLSAVAGTIPRLIQGDHGWISPEQLEAHIRPRDLHFPPPRLLCLENTHNRAGGRAFTPEQITRTCAVARRYGLKIHLDGARIFNASVALGVDARALTRDVDSVMFCLSKGLSAPVGSILAGEREFIERARKARKMLGGGMRQAGVLAACGIIALETMIPRLAEDHRRARMLATGLARIPGLSVDVEGVQTNIVLVEIEGPDGDAREVVQRLRSFGILVNAVGKRTIRLVTHRHITDEDVEKTLEAFSAATKSL